MPRARPISVALTLLASAILAYWFITAPAGSPTLRQFDPNRMAELELRMWQAYYGKDRIRLFALLVTQLHEQNHYSWANATRAGFYLARAAATFGDARANYETVLPDLEHAYRIARESLRAGFNPRTLAGAELAWWVARRTPGENSPEHVGALMAEAYTLMYEAPRARVVRAALLRAQAAALRDAEANQPDWDAIGRLLRESYRDLRLELARDSTV